jgi:hypothetical protein
VVQLRRHLYRQFRQYVATRLRKLRMRGSENEHTKGLNMPKNPDELTRDHNNLLWLLLHKGMIESRELCVDTRCDYMPPPHIKTIECVAQRESHP